jgi:hypothetical protein
MSDLLGKSIILNFCDVYNHANSVCGAEPVRNDQWRVVRGERELLRRPLVESSRLEREAIVCFLWVSSDSNNRSSRLERGVAIEVRGEY